MTDPISEYKRLSPAKINLILRVGKKRKDRFHEIETLMAKLNWGDDIRLQVRQASRTKVSIQCSEKAIENPSNLAVKAAYLFSESIPVFFEAKISIKKRIALEAGLAGGSSNAALVLLMLFEWYRSKIGKLSFSKLEEWAAELGSDVCFFLSKENSAWCTGRGEKCKALKLKDWPLVLVFPNVGISTAWAYKNLPKPRKELEGQPDWLKQKAWTKSGFVPALENDFQEQAIRENPELERLQKDLALSGAQAGLMSGSGASFFGLYSTNKEASRALGFLSERGWRAVKTQIQQSES